MIERLEPVKKKLKPKRLVLPLLRPKGTTVVGKGGKNAVTKK